MDETAQGGIYVHVPFCKSRCIYCDFFSSTRGEAEQEAYVAALQAEMHARKHEVKGIIATVYFGGGTPSLLSPERLSRIVASLRKHFTFAPETEFTIEANPDDITGALVEAWQSVGVNRVSLGVQTFSDEILRRIGRRHTARQAREAVNLVAATIPNISIDLIYGLPGQDRETWLTDLETAFALPVKHLSAYSLTVENGTRLGEMVRRGEEEEVSDELASEMYKLLRERAAKAGFVHYELSNFSLPDTYSRHNSSYWNGTPYLGLGPGAHSFDGKALRRHNLPDLNAYIRNPGAPPCTEEHLSAAERYNERVFTALRTRRGLCLSQLADDERIYLECQAARHIIAGRLVREWSAKQPGTSVHIWRTGHLIREETFCNDRTTSCGYKTVWLRLAPESLFVSDGILADLMKVE